VSDEINEGDHRHQAPHQGLRRLVLTNCDSYEHTYPPGSHRGVIRLCNQQPRNVVAVLEGLAKNHDSTNSPGASWSRA
jgi:hypothetical protein